MNLALEVRDLEFSYPDGRQALGGVDLAIETGTRVAVLGPNGAGKTTLALHLNGILRGSGVVTVGGLELNDDNLNEIRRRVGIVFQDANDQLFMPTVGEDVAFGPANLGLRGAELEARVEAALGEVDATELAQRPPHHLSGGEKRSAAIATALAMEPQILVLDEPTSGLDPLGRRELVQTLQGLDLTLLVITHDLPFALELCQRSIIVDRGTVVAEGPTAEILANDALLQQHRLEMPFGFNGSALGDRSTGS
ncbi:MAG: ABC transporter ATP-binding protein [Acidimicrobiia bacterium]|nr:ABC transporter ATP-binding protein [Acidimicrobiia bacterium]